MTVQRAGFYLLAALAVSGWGLAWWHSRQSDPITAADAERVLGGRGYHPATGPAKIPDLPPGATPGTVVRGRVPFGPPAQRPLAVSGPESGSQPPVGPSPAGPGSPDSGPCVIHPDDLSGGCTTSIAYVLGKPWAKVEWDGAVRLPGGQIVSRGPVLADQVELTWTPPPPPRRTLWGLDVGLVAALGELGHEIGGRVCPKGFALSGRLAEARLCGYGRYTQLPGRPEGAIGVSILFGGGR